VLDAVFQANLVKKVNQESQVVQVNRATQVTQDSLVPHHLKSAKFQPNHRATHAHQVQQVQLDHQEKMAKTVTTAKTAVQAKMVHQAMPDQTLLLPHRFKAKDQMVTQEAPAHQAHQAQEAKTVNQAAQAPKVHQAQQDQRAKTAKPDPKDPKVPKAHQAKKVSVQNIALWMVVYFSKMEPVVNNLFGLSTKYVIFNF